MDKEIASWHQMKGILDDDYTLYMSGKIVHEFDKHIYRVDKTYEKNSQQTY